MIFLTLEAYVLPGRPLRLAPKGGRSSSGALPFFQRDQGAGEGYLAGIGWTGQWQVEFSREAAGVRAHGAGADPFSPSSRRVGAHPRHDPDALAG